MFHHKTLKTTHITLININPTHLKKSHIIIHKLINSTKTNNKITYHTQQKKTLQNTNFVIITFQINNYKPYTITNFKIYKQHNLKQTITNTLKPNNIIHTLHTIPHL